ncbi:MAG: hypothetical protein HY699_19775 [Deltaproteobacteria bacterium]|nr:hypothetical protein [Deltaproteobacteria bacterium]
MANDNRPKKPRVDEDGVRVVRTANVRTGVWLLAAAIGLVGLAVFLFIRPILSQRSREPTQASAVARGATVSGQQPATAPGTKPLHAPAGARVRVPHVPTRALVPQPAGEARPAGSEPDHAQDSAPAEPGQDDDTAAAEEEEKAGIALFPPPGTKPIKRGMVVPEDFAIPPGYVRHYQATDDGKRLPAILMFHPDYKPVDEHGEPLAIPDDRVVPPEMAPPGLAVQMLEVPEVRVPMVEEPPENPVEQEPEP